MSTQPALGGTFTPAGTSLSLHRMGYGAMQLPGPHVFGPPADREAAIALLQQTRTLGINHIDTADFYGPHVSNDLIREALSPYADNLHIVTKIGYVRGSDGAWNPAQSAGELERSVHSELEHLGLQSLDVVNLRVGESTARTDESVATPLRAVTDLQAQGLVKHIGLSNVTQAQYDEGRTVADIVCVQNHYNLTHRDDDAMIDTLAAQGVAYVPFFPLGGFTPLQSTTLSAVAAELKASPMQVALAWLLQRAPNLLLIPGTSQQAHLHENVKAATLELPADSVVRLDGIADESHS